MFDDLYSVKYFSILSSYKRNKERLFDYYDKRTRARAIHFVVTATSFTTITILVKLLHSRLSKTYPKKYVSTWVKTSCVNSCFIWLVAFNQNSACESRYCTLQNFSIFLVTRHCVHHHKINWLFRGSSDLEKNVDLNNLILQVFSSFVYIFC